MYSKSCDDGHLKDILVIMQYCKFMLILFELCIYILYDYAGIKYKHTDTSYPHIYFNDILNGSQDSYVVGGSPTHDGSRM